MKRKLPVLLVALAFLSGLTTSGYTETALTTNAPAMEPLWEIGIFGAFARIPDYKGSDEYTVYAFPLPYFIYRGKILQADREGLRGIFLNTPSVESDVSVYGNPPVNRYNQARRGMPSLDPIVEIGPALKWYLKPRKPRNNLYIEAALRSVISADVPGSWELKYRGLHGDLGLTYEKRSLTWNDKWGYGMSMGVDWGDEEYNEYFYAVQDSYATPFRPAFTPKSGYGGFAISGSVDRKITRRLSFSIYGRWDNVTGAVFEDSPLVRARNNVVMGCALTWTLAESATLQPVINPANK